jgi:hypothetical protein
MRKFGAIFLTDFFAEKSYFDFDAFQQASWTEAGPLHLRFFEICNQNSPLKSFFTSIEFRNFAQQLLGTELELNQYEMRRFVRGKHYSLLSDLSVSENEQILEIVFSTSNGKVDVEDYEMSHGGYLSYIDVEDGENLLTFFPENNSISFALLEKNVGGFVKYLR